ncbi:MAG: hypothetical protein U1A72_12435, partial [Sulfuritalea sp.]|nr:hypothetical protein [Sulfuritalea sp.]
MQKMLSVMFLLWLSFSCSLVEAATSSALSTSQNVSSTTYVAQQNEALIEKYKVTVENQDKRLSDIWGAVNILGFIAALLGVLTTAIVVFFSLRSASTAVAEAKIEASKTIEDWLKSNAEKLLLEETKKVIAPQLEHALKEIREAATPILVALDVELQKTVKLNEDLEAKLGTSKATEADERSHADQAASQQDSLAQSPSSPSTTPTLVRTVGHPSRPLLRQAQSLVREDRYAEAIAIIDSITEQLRGSTDEQDQVMYMEACLERISITDRLGDQSKAHSEYAKLSLELASNTSPTIAKVLLRTLYAQALIEEKIGHLEVAVATCDKLISVVDQFNFTSKPELLRLIRAL